MKKNFKDATIFYQFFDKKSDVVNLYLHGWGVDHKSLLFCHKFLKNQSSLFIDFPPFGKSSKSICDWTVFTYANMVISICEHLKLKKVNIIGHSFGGRIAIILSVIFKEKVNKVVIVDGAGLKPRCSLKYYFQVMTYKIKRKLGFDISKYGSRDYLALDENMKKIFKSVVSTHLDDFLPLISAPTLVVFGENDDVTPIYMAKRFERKIKNSKLIILKNAGHFCFVDRRLEFLTELQKFLKNKEV